jgi:hypothetical protein
MEEIPGARFVAVYDTARSAREAADAAARAGASMDDVRIDEPLDHVASVRGEMLAEVDNAFAAPGVAPHTEETTKGILLLATIGAIVGAVVAAPFALIGFNDWSLGIRLLLLVIVGASFGGTIGWVVGGGFGARRPGETLAAERGVTVTAPALEAVKNALVDAAPIRIDLVDATGRPMTAVTTEADRDSLGVAHDLGKHMGGEERDS